MIKNIKLILLWSLLMFIAWWCREEYLWMTVWLFFSNLIILAEFISRKLRRYRTNEVDKRK